METSVEHHNEYVSSEVEVLREEIKELEARLCPELPEKLMLASRLIDRPLFEAALVTGQPPELFFGHRHWRNFLQAHEFISSYDGPLVPDFIVNVHSIFARDDDRLKKVVETMGTTTSWTIAYSDLSIPSGISVENAADAVAKNPDIEFLRLRELSDEERSVKTTKLKPTEDYMTGDPGDSGYDYFVARLLRERGLVIDPEGERLILSYCAKSPQRKAQRMADICNAYNTQAEPNPIRRAAILQHQLISLHPFLVDYNGRTSRLLMDWALGQAGMPGAMLADFDDLFRTPADWADQVETACERTAICLMRATETGNPIEIFDLCAERQAWQNLGEAREAWCEGLCLKDDTPGNEYEYDLKHASIFMENLKK